VQKWDTYFVPDTNTDTPSPPGNSSNWMGHQSGNSFVNASNDMWANRGCPPMPITTLTNVKQDLIDAVDDLVNPRGNTHINVGAVWACRLFSPRRRGLWVRALVAIIHHTLTT